MNSNIFSLNQILCPDISFEEFILFTKKLNINFIEIRNDIKTNLIAQNEPIKIKNICNDNQINILSINALQKFNIWNKEREDELISLCKYAEKANINSIVLVPLNDGSIKSENEKLNLLNHSLIHINSILKDYNRIGLVEPLGFNLSSLRNKSIVSNIINNLQTDRLKLVHDTFHHYLANESDFFPSLTGLVHFSGVSNLYKDIDLKDSHRSIVDDKDIIENISQIKTLLNNNYKGQFSFEPFSEELIKTKDIYNIVNRSINFIKTKIN